MVSPTRTTHPRRAVGGILTTDDGMYRMGVWERRNAARPALGSWLNVVIEVLVLPATPPTGSLLPLRTS